VIESHAARTLVFGPFHVDVRTGELRNRGVRIRLQRKPFQILEVLLEHPEELIQREELRQKLWPDHTFLDFDHSVGTAMGKLRQALGDSAHKPRFIETLGNRGYRFIAPVTELQGMPRVDQNHPALLPGHAGAVHELPAKPAWFFRSVADIEILLARLGLARFLGQWPGVQPGTFRPDGTQSVAVLPLESLCNDQHHEYFADGMTDALITELAKSGSLRVISRTSVMRYKKTRKPLPEIAQELKVEAVLEGTVMHSRGRVRISAHLIRVPSEKHLWAEIYERDMHDELALQAEVALSIANEIRVKLMP
jgi:TolB-like protein/DNA-binding winged helix-turn-helix (wHTH) protein